MAMVSIETQFLDHVKQIVKERPEIFSAQADHGQGWTQIGGIAYLNSSHGLLSLRYRLTNEPETFYEEVRLRSIPNETASVIPEVDCEVCALIHTDQDWAKDQSLLNNTMFHAVYDRTSQGWCTVTAAVDNVTLPEDAMLLIDESIPVSATGQTLKEIIDEIEIKHRSRTSLVP